MTEIKAITIETDDVDAARDFYRAAFGVDEQIGLRASRTPTSGFRGFTLSLVVAQPADADAYLAAALAEGATSLKPGAKSLWGYGGAVQAPDGTVWTVATANKKNRGPAVRGFDELVLQLGVEDVAASRDHYVAHGLEVAKSYGRKYVQFADGGPVRLALYGRKALAKTVGLPPEGSGSHRLVLTVDAEPFTDADGFEWEAAI